jgi:glycosyltransferase involved in cell wall biosynthesis
MRVAFDATALIGRRTGIGNCTAEVINRLPRQDLDIIAFAVSARGAGALSTMVPAGVATVTRPMAARPLRLAWRRANHPKIERWTGPVDVVHGPNFVVPPSRASEIVTVHDLTCVRFPELCTPDTLQLPSLLERAIARGAWVHTVSSFVADEVIAHFNIDADRVIAIPNGTTQVVAEAERVALAARAGDLIGTDRYVLSLGTIEPRKDIPTLITAFELIAVKDPGVVLVIAGPDGWGSDQVASAIEQSPVRSRIRRLGWLPDTDRDALLAGAAVFVYPSLYEGFGLPPLEAMAFGTPVVATRVGALPEVLGDAAQWAEAGQPDSLASAMAAVLDDEDHAASLLRMGRDRVALYDWDITVDALVKLYASVADEPHSGDHPHRLS